MHNHNQKIKKLIIITSPLYVRNYIQTDAFSKILDDNTYVACLSGIITEDIVRKYWNFSGIFSVSKINKALFTYASLLLMYDNRELNKGFYFYFKKHNTSIYFRSQNLKEKVHSWCSNKTCRCIMIQIIEIFRPFKQFKKLLQFLSIVTISAFGLTNKVLNFCRFIFPKNQELDKILSNIMPDLVLIPNGGLDPVASEVMNLSQKKYNFKTMLLIDNWDNLCSKSKFLYTPDFLCVWGEQAKNHAINFHDFSPEDVFIAGTPRYDVYTNYLQKPSEERLINFPYILFAGCWPKFDEIEVLELLDTLVEKYKKILPDGCKVLYRPHPWGENYDKLDFLESKQLKNIAIDPQMSQKSRPDDYRRRTDFQPKLDYYPILLDNCEFVICPLASIIIEASIMKKNILILAHDDNKNLMNPAMMYRNSDYFDRLDEMCNNKFVHFIEELDTKFYEMITSEMTIEESALNYYIVNNGTNYQDRIKTIYDGLPLFNSSMEIV